MLGQEGRGRVGAAGCHIAPVPRGSARPGGTGRGRGGLAGIARSAARSPSAPCAEHQHGRHLVELSGLDVPGDDTGVKFLPRPV